MLQLDNQSQTCKLCTNSQGLLQRCWHGNKPDPYVYGAPMKIEYTPVHTPQLYQIGLESLTNYTKPNPTWHSQTTNSALDKDRSRYHLRLLQEGPVTL